MFAYTDVKAATGLLFVLYAAFIVKNWTGASSSQTIIHFVLQLASYTLMIFTPYVHCSGLFCTKHWLRFHTLVQVANHMI